MFWFGEPWPSAESRASVCEDDNYRIETPVGELCILCGEAIETWAQGIQYSYRIDPDKETGKLVASLGAYAHIECQLRSVMGNMIHINGDCHHIGECNEKSTKTWREEGKEVWEALTNG